MLFSSTKNSAEYIEFLNDSILARKPYYSNIGCSLANLQEKNEPKTIYHTYLYKKNKDTIVIFQFENGKDVKFKIVNNIYFENYENKEVYVRRKEFDKFPDIAVIYKKDIYWIHSSETSNGIIIKNGKKSRKLKKIFKNKNAQDIQTKLYQGYDAFEKFGYKYIFGIIEIKDNE